MNVCFSDGWYSAYNLGTGIYHITEQNSANMYLIIGTDNCLLFDNGFGAGNLLSFIREITALPLIAVISHGHLDHSCGNSLFEEVFCGEADLPFLHNEGLEQKRMFCRGAITAHPSDQWGSVPGSRLIAVHDGDVFDLGGRKLNVMEFPGHTKGSICLLDDKTHIAFAGDNIVPFDSFGEVRLHLPESASVKTYADGVSRLILHNPSQIASGHGGIGLIDASVLKNMSELLTDILSGTITGMPRKCIIGGGLSACRDSVGIVYHENIIY